MNRRIMLPALAIAAAATAVGGGTFATYLDKEEAPHVSVTAGTLDLEVGGSAITVDFDATNVKPGDSHAPSNGYQLMNTGSLPGTLRVYLVKDADDENLALEPEIEDGDSPSDVYGELDEYVKVIVDGNSFGASSILPGLETVGVGGRVDITSMIWGGNPGPIMVPAGGEYPGTPYELWFGWSVENAADDTIQSDTVGFHLEFELAQA